MSEDTNTNEKKFHVDEFAVNIGRHVNSSIDKGNNVKVCLITALSLGFIPPNVFPSTDDP